MTAVNSVTEPAMKDNRVAQVRLTQRSPAYWRVTIDNPPVNVMGPEMVRQFQEVMNAIEADEGVRVVVFDSAVDGVAVGTAIADRPPHRSVRAELPHTAPA